MNIQHLIDRIEKFALEHGTKPDTVCRAATGNPRLWSRLSRRLEQTRVDADRIAAYMEKHSHNSPSAGGE